MASIPSATDVILHSEKWQPVSNPHRVVKADSCAADRSFSDGSSRLPVDIERDDGDGAVALRHLRRCLNASCRRNCLQNSREVLLTSLKRADKDCNGKLSLLNFADALRSVGGVIRKVWMRPLHESQEVFEGNLLKYNQFFDELDKEPWWPTSNALNLNAAQAKSEGDSRKAISHNHIDLTRPCKATSSAKACHIGPMNMADLTGPTRSTVKSEVSSKPLKLKSTSSPYQRSISQPAGSWSLPTLESKKGVRSTNLPLLPTSARTGTLSSVPQNVQNLMTKHAKAHPRSVSRLRAMNYSSSLLACDSPFRKSLEYTSRFWRKTAFPANAIQYRRWDLLRSIVPGFSHPRQVPNRIAVADWNDPLPIVKKSRSYDKEEDWSKSCLQILDLKQHRSDVNLTLEANRLLKIVRRLVVKGNYDQALQSAGIALQHCKVSEIDLDPDQMHEAVDHVAEMVESEIQKMLKVGRDALKRNKFQKALSQIPALLKASIWLEAHSINPSDNEISIKSTQHVRIKSGMEKVEELTGEIIAAEKSFVLGIEGVSLNSYFVNVRKEFDQCPAPDLQDAELARKSKNELPRQIVADGQVYIIVVDVKPPDLPEHLSIGTKLKIQGLAILGSGRKDDGSKPRRGLVTAFNERSSKYKVQYSDDYEWISWPCPFQIQIDIDPEDVLIEIPFFAVQSKTVDKGKCTADGQSVLVVSFVVTPQGPPFDFSHFGHVAATVKGVKGGKSLLDVSNDVVEIVPPEFLWPAQRYFLFDSLSNEALDCGSIEFTEAGGKIYKFKHRENVFIPENGVYSVSCRGQEQFKEPGLTSHHRTCVVLDGRCTIDSCKVFLNRPIRSPEVLRVLVAWGCEPLELDSHVYTSSGLHLDYKSCSMNSTVNQDDVNKDDVCFNMDSCTGYGPETISIRVRKNLQYSFSLSLPSGAQANDSCKWSKSLASVALFDCNGLFAMFHVSPGGQHVNNLQWWHVFALDGTQWHKPGHGILRINKLSASPMPELAVPGWTLIEAVKEGRWDLFCELMHDIIKGKFSREEPMLIPHDLANVTSMEGETILGLICLHNEGNEKLQDPSQADKADIIPLQKQVNALQQFLAESGKLAQAGDSLMSGGLPSAETFEHELKMQGIENCYIYRAAVHASTEVAMIVLGHLSAFVKRSVQSSGYRRFFEKYGDQLLLACIENREYDSIIPILRGLLENDAIWQRRAARKFQTGDPVQVETPPGSGDWVDGIVEEVMQSLTCQRVHNTFRVRLINRHQKTRDICLQGTTISEEGKMIVNNVCPANLRWRSYAVEKMLIKYRHCQEQVQAISHFTQKDRASARSDQLRSIRFEAICKEALALLSEKAFL